MNSIYIIISLFAIGAIFGMYLLSVILRNKQTSGLAMFAHGAFVVIALLLLISYSKEQPGLVDCLVLFGIAALGGIILMVRDVAHKPVPKWLAIGHGLIALSGFILLLARTVI
jgi:hypothetical protein